MKDFSTTALTKYSLTTFAQDIPSAPLDLRHKSNHEQLLRGPQYRLSQMPYSLYKEFRLHFPIYYSRALFHTVSLYPHQESFQRLTSLSCSHLARHVRRIVISLPFFTCEFMEFFLGKHPKYRGNFELYWHKIPQCLPQLISRFPNLRTVIILPSWDRRLHWIQHQRVRIIELERLFQHSWFGCMSGDPKCQGQAELHEAMNLISLLRHIDTLRDQVRNLHVFNLGTEWLTLLTRQTNIVDSDLFPMSPATIVNLELSSYPTVKKLDVLSCAIHDLVFFSPIFHGLDEIWIECLSARDSRDVSSFTSLFNDGHFPRMRKIVLKSSDLLPRDYLQLFAAVRDHRSLEDVIIESVHMYCEDSKFGQNFKFCTAVAAVEEVQQMLLQYLRNEQISTHQLETKWLNMFLRSGSSSKHLSCQMLTCLGCTHI